jgi:hypothetical protein
VQIGPLKFSLQPLGFMRDHDILVPWQPDFDAHHRRDRLLHIARSLIDANPARGQTLVDVFKAGDVISDFVFSPIRMLDIMKRDFEGHLHCSHSLDRPMDANAWPQGWFGCVDSGHSKQKGRA